VISFSRLYQAMAAEPALAPWVTPLQTRLVEALQQGHGDLFRWQQVLKQLPAATPSIIGLDKPCPQIGQANDLADPDREFLRELLIQLHPWRKGPFELFGIHIDAEWRSDLKWARLANHIEPLTNRLVLDVGSGNGYYALRMLGAGARMVLAIDPTWLFVVQFQAIANYIGDTPAHVVPLAMEQLPANMGLFDTVFSMGVLYHRRSPVTHMQELWQALRPGGQLVLETLVNEPGVTGVLLPGERYAKMRNVWFIPSTDTLGQWLRHAGFRDIAVVDETVTTSMEQRRTDWMRFESLADYLDPDDTGKTIEGYPAPRRALITATKT